MGDRIVDAVCNPGFKRAERFITSVSSAFLFMAVEALVDREVGAAFQPCFFEIECHNECPPIDNATNAIIIT